MSASRFLLAPVILALPPSERKDIGRGGEVEIPTVYELAVNLSRHFRNVRDGKMK